MKRVIVAVIILVIAALSFLAGGWYGRNGSAGPGFRSDKPGIAPTGMPLEPMYADAGEEQASVALGAVSMSPGAVKISMARQQLIGVNVSPVEVKPMTYILRLYGRVVSDETKIYRINASTDSWVRQLSDITTGSIVEKDQLLAEVLAPAFYNAQVTYLVAMDNLDRIRRQLGEEIRHQQTLLADNQIRMAVQSLQNLGITDAQIEELANTRQAQPYLQVRSPADGVVLSRNLTLYQWFKAGEEFYDIADIGRVWVYADVYEDEAMHMRPGMNVKVRHEQMGKTFDARVGEVLPLFDPTARTLKVRVDIDNPRYDLRPDMFVDVEIPIAMPPSVNVPADAVLDTGTRAIVYVDLGSGIFEPRRVKTGWRLGRQVEITGGLMPGERVVVSGNFLIDSESRLEIAGLGAGANMSDDPVCGRYVDKDEAESFERVATYGNETFYFCSDRCKKEFEKEPGKYVRKEQIDREKEAHLVTPGTERSWADLIEAVKGRHAMKKSGTFPGQEMKRIIGAPASSPGVVDWDGDVPAREWPPGWGGFPGAKYLGLKKNSSQESRAGSQEKTAEETDSVDVSGMPDACDHEMEHENQDQPASGEPQPSDNQ